MELHFYHLLILRHDIDLDDPWYFVEKSTLKRGFCNVYLKERKKKKKKNTNNEW